MPTECVPPTLVVDAAIFQIIDSKLCVLLIKRARDPFKDTWALPGGYNPRGETTREAFKRVLRAKAGVLERDLNLVEQLYTFDTVARDPRGHAVSVTYMGLASGISPQVSPDTQSPAFFPIESLPPLAYDHAAIIQYARERLSAKLEHTAAAGALLPPAFTLSQLQIIYEVVLGHPIDKRNFRKRFLAFGTLTQTDTFAKNGAHRPARLYSFAAAPTQPLAQNFE